LARDIVRKNSKDLEFLAAAGLGVLRKGVAQDAVTYEGKHFKVRNLELRPQPTQKPHPPIWVAAKNKAAVELAAEVGYILADS
jgi:alkanesulfonate monooxygenase SsuD/methylene tetrahydromethanopterin reductase-like flavin-dependent oxidoreductase (luciferase family)